MQRISLVALLCSALTACADSNRPAPNYGRGGTPMWGAASPGATKFFTSQPGGAEAARAGPPTPGTGTQPAGMLTTGASSGTPFLGNPFAGLEMPGLPLPGILSSAPGTGLTPGMTFKFAVGDEIATMVWKEPELTSSQKIMPDGTIAPPLLKSTKVAGLTVDEAQTVLTKAYTEFLKDPKVSVRVSGIQSDRVFVAGEVRSPQAVTLTGPTTVMQAITMAGGFMEETADKSSVQVVRRGPDGVPHMAHVDARHILDGGRPDQPLERGDMVFVPAKGITNWARFMSQLFSPLSTAIGTAGAAATIQQTTR